MTTNPEAQVEDGDERRSKLAAVRGAVEAAEGALDVAYRKLRGSPRRLVVIPFLGHGNREVAIVRGRVLADDLVRTADRVESTPRRVGRMVRRFITNEVPNVELVVRVGEASARVVTDGEGYFRVEMAGHALPEDRALHDVDVRVADPRGLPVRIHPARVVVPTPRARRLIVSDLDDTVLHSQATDRVRLVVNTLTGSSVTRNGFPGTNVLFDGLVRGPGLDEDNPVAWVSSSPWNIQDFLTAFLQRSGLPMGPLFLREIGDPRRLINPAHADHKRAAIGELMTVHDLPVVLIGDTGERDPEIYADVVAANPGRVEAVLLRHVADDRRLAALLRRDAHHERWPSMHVGAATEALAEGAEAAGLVPPGWFERVAAAG